MSASLPPPPGYYVPAVLFFDENEELDVPNIKAHVLRLAQGGVTGILVQGSNGEAQHLSHDERKQAIALTRRTLDENGFQNVLVIAGTGAQSTRETKKLCVDAKAAGASHALVADGSPIPTMIYNFPVVTAGQDLNSDILSTLAEHPNIVGTKLSCGNIGKLQRLTTHFPSSEFAVYAGRSDTFLHGLNAGSAGTIAALVNLVPKLHGKLYKLFQEGKHQEAMALQGKLGQGDWAASKVGGIGGIKAVISRNFGYGTPNVRGPLKTVNLDNFAENKYYTTLLELIEMEKAL
ncbi:hypothetical protein NLJ89_g6504 [Agrocybe chaxingu]|uniref:Dihydrodipicolinate synthetase n=1 Tax=Agrocybe chaxingu TaxID=84603 RepID=A0A9W8JYH4_9AGAR|nr:hypothetical protein NLJ89_g6504 [Agrocybe chaxingu]